MQFMSEVFDESKTIIVEGTGGEKDYFIEGVFMQSDIKNRNGRIYPGSIMESQVGSYNTTFVERNRAYGELDHPAGPSVNLDRVSHNIVSLRKEGHDVMGKAKLMDTPMGNIAKAIVREGCQLGVSSRGLGSIKESEGARVVQGDFRLTAIDIVGDPSAPSAFVNGIMEGREWIIVDGVLVEQDLDALQAMVDEDTRKGGAVYAEANIMSNIGKMLDNAKRL